MQTSNLFAFVKGSEGKYPITQIIMQTVTNYFILHLTLIYLIQSTFNRVDTLHTIIHTIYIQYNLCANSY